MADPLEPTGTPPPPAAAPPPAAPPPGAPPRKGMSTGVKVAIGCGVLLALVVIVVVIMTVAGGMFLKNKTEDFGEGMEEQAEATETVQQLEADHPFTPPADGVVAEGRADKFFAVTDDAWDNMRELVEDMEERGEDIEERGGEAGFGDVMAGMRGLGGSRVVLAEALESNEMPVSEYLWTGLTLMRAYESLDEPAAQSGVPPENLEVATEHREALAELEGGNEEAADKSMVLGMAWTFTTDGTVQVLGWDTLGQYAPQP